MTKTAPSPVPTFYAPTVAAWRTWLEEHAGKEKAVRLIIYHVKSTTPSVHFAEAIEHALCFGWVDSKANKRDKESFYLKFSARNPKSAWSTVNKERALVKIKEGLMRPGGQAMIDLAKRTGTWDMFAEAHNGVVPDDLMMALRKNRTALTHFEAFPPSAKRMVLEWLAKAKRPETRLRRIERTVELAEQNIRANQPQMKKPGQA